MRGTPWSRKSLESYRRAFLAAYFASRRAFAAASASTFLAAASSARRRSSPSRNRCHCFLRLPSGFLCGGNGTFLCSPGSVGIPYGLSFGGSSIAGVGYELLFGQPRLYRRIVG